MAGRGDINEILKNKEKLRALPKDNSFIDNFKDALDDCNLKDLDFKGPSFPWTSRRNENCIWERLDCFLCNSSFENLFERLTILHLNSSSSNHWPIELSLNTRKITRRFKRRIFRFEESWSIHPECKKVSRENGRCNVGREQFLS